MIRTFQIQTSIKCEQVDPKTLKWPDRVWYTINKYKDSDLHGPFDVVVQDNEKFLVNPQSVRIALNRFIKTCTFWKEIEEELK